MTAAVGLLTGLALLVPGVIQAQEIKVGFNIPLTGDIPKVGEGTKYAAELYLAELNAAGGLKLGDKSYKLKFIYEDNESKAESATAAALKLIAQDGVLAMIGPQSSKQAIPAGEV
ncbi:MAG: branched-chain amino acid ABC transporter substrate-binding protein, partial [Desulfobulbaceae bacterium A2]